MATRADLVQRLAEVVGEAHVLHNESDWAPFATDWRGRFHGTPLCVVRPGDTDSVARVIVACRDAGVPVVPQGGNTGLCGGATPTGGEVVVSLGRLNRVRHVDAVDNAIIVEAGCTLAAVQAEAAKVDRLFPLSLAAEGSATIGGNLSTNAGGVHVLRYGTTRDLVLGLEVVLADGNVWHGLRTLRKDNTGYDLRHLFVGAEGTLGVITAASLKLFARPRHRAVAWVGIESPARAVELLALMRDSAGEAVNAFELVGESALELVEQHIPGSRSPMPERYPWYLLVELASATMVDESLESAMSIAMERAIVTDAVIATTEAQANALWALRENISEAQKREGFSIKHDVAVPVSMLAEFLFRADDAVTTGWPGLRIVCFGHVGDGNLHYNLSMRDASANAELIASSLPLTRAIHDLVMFMGGSFSAEHGIGQLKRDELARYKPALDLELMQRIKQVFDPQGTMNPCKVLPE